MSEELNPNFNQMDKKLFKENLLKTIEEIISTQKYSFTHFKFIITIDQEITKNHNSTDDWMRLVVFKNYDIENKVRQLDEVVDFLVYSDSRFPLWINVSVNELKEDYIIFKLESSSRFRKLSELQNIETNHPPFKAIY